MRILITRHELVAEKLEKTLRADRFDVQCEPLLEIKFDVKPVSIDDVQALIVTSSSGAGALARGTENRTLPTFAVGNATAAALNNEGFEDIRTAAGDVAALAEFIAADLSPEDGPLVHITGEHVAGNLAGTLTAKGFSVRREISYRADTPDDFSSAVKKSLSEHKIDVVLFFSPRTARTFASLMAKACLTDYIGMVSAACLSEEVAKPIRNLGWQKIVIAKTPDQQALLQTLHEMREEIKGRPVAKTEQTENRKQGVPDAHGPPPRDLESQPTAPGTTVIVKNGAPWRFVSILALLLILATAYIVWPLWAPGLPGWMHTVLAPVMEAGRAAAVTGRVDLLTKRLSAVENDLTTIKVTLAKTSEAVSGVVASSSKDAIKQIDTGQRTLFAEVKSLVVRLDDLGTKVADLTSMSNASEAARTIDVLAKSSSGKMIALRKENTVLNALIKDLGNRLKALESRSVNGSGLGKRNALLLAVGQLRDATRTANEFSTSFAAVQTLSIGSLDNKVALDVLERYAAKGVPDLPVLQRRFDRLSGDIVRAGYTPAGDGWVNKTLLNLSELITFRRTGVEGALQDDIAGLVARVELLLSAGDLKAAVGIVNKLLGGPAQVSRKWLKDAKARLGVDTAVNNLFQNALQGARGNGGSGG